MDLALWQPVDAEQVGVATFVLASGRVDTWTGQQITASTIAPLITPSTKAISVVHLGGWPADMPRSSSWPVAGDPGYTSTMAFRRALIRAIAIPYVLCRTQSLLKHPLRAPGVLWIRAQ